MATGRAFDNGTVQFICVEDANPLATHFTWKRKQNFSSEAAVQLGSGRIISGENYPSGFYFCEVTNQIGSTEAYINFFSAPRNPGVASFVLGEFLGCLHAWPWLYQNLLIMCGVAIYQCYLLWRKRKPEDTA